MTKDARVSNIECEPNHGQTLAELGIGRQRQRTIEAAKKQRRRRVAKEHSNAQRAAPVDNCRLRIERRVSTSGRGRNSQALTKAVCEAQHRRQVAMRAHCTLKERPSRQCRLRIERRVSTRGRSRNSQALTKAVCEEQHRRRVAMRAHCTLKERHQSTLPPANRTARVDQGAG